MTGWSTRLFISDDRPDARQAASDRQQPLERRPDPDPEHLGSERHATTAAAESFCRCRSLTKLEMQEQPVPEGDGLRADRGAGAVLELVKLKGRRGVPASTWQCPW